MQIQHSSVSITCFIVHYTIPEVDMPTEFPFLTLVRLFIQYGKTFLVVNFIVSLS